MRVFILSDIRLVRDGLASSLSKKPGIEIVGHLAPTEDAVAEVCGLDGVTVLLDVGGASAIEVARQIKRQAPGLAVIAFGVDEIDDMLVACVEAGVSGYVARDGSTCDVVAAIRSAVRGEITCSPRVSALLARRLATLAQAIHSTPDSAAEPRLTRREREIADLLDRGLSNKDIARTLHISVATAKNHVHSILEKLNVRRRGEAVARLRGTALE